MNVAIVQEHADVRRGGAETSTAEMARCLASLGLDVTVVCRSPHPTATPPPAAASAVKYHYVAVNERSKTKATMDFVFGTDGYFLTHAFDIIHAITPCLQCNVYQPRGGTYVETVRQSVARSGSLPLRLLKRVGRRMNRRQHFLRTIEYKIMAKREYGPCVAAVSDYVARQVREHFPAFPGEKVRVVFNGVGLKPLDPQGARRLRAETRRSLAVDDRTREILFIAHNFKLKGLPELLAALPRLRDLPWKLSVIGRGDPNRYQRLARRLGIADRVRFRGPIDDVRPLYYAADLLAHPTWYDPCSRVVLEALTCGLPVVTTRFNGAAEVVDPARHGAIIDTPRDTAALAAAIGHCLGADIADACRSDSPRMHELLSMSRHARELAMLYQGLCS